MNFLKKPIFFAIALFVFGSNAQNTLTLSVGSAKDTVRRELFGGLMENYGWDLYRGLYVCTSSTIPNTNGMRNDLIRLMKEAGLNTLNWPGGCFAEKYNWKDGIGPKNSRPLGDTGNGMGTAEYFQFCQLTNSIPYITADLTVTDTNVMADWLTYIDTISTNPEWKTQLKYWKMGNEWWNACNYAKAYAASVYAARYDMYRRNIPAKWAGKLFRIADGGSGNSATVGTYRWLDTVLMRNLGNVEGLAYHYYGLANGTDPSTGFTAAQYYAKIAQCWKMDANVDSCLRHMDVLDPNRTTKLVIDEWGAWYTAITGMGKSYQQSTTRDAVIAGMTENIFINRAGRIQMALVAQPMNAIQCLFLTKSGFNWSQDSSIVKTPTFYVFKQLKKHQLGKMVPASLVCSNIPNNQIPSISASASIDSTGNLNISLVNAHIDSVRGLTIQTTGAPKPYTSISGSIVTGATDSSYNDFNKAENVSMQPFAATNYSLSGSVVTVTIPAHSVVMLTLSPGTGTSLTPQEQGIPGLWLKPTSGGILVNYSAERKTPVRLSLYGLDGKSIGVSADLMMEPGKQSVTWRPKGVIANRAYLVKARVNDKTMSRRMVFGM